MMNDDDNDDENNCDRSPMQLMRRSTLSMENDCVQISDTIRSQKRGQLEG